ncbi:uncharacterized protein N7477_008065 [Penicillium maclennaniae]|uniref:uncharacterized protein n=1 Tax=Penicillium maclennaniae TaxID=1343394 RepID=UPI0025406F71|nr:uncharacterized protein N7477_008065 [Penicillium maclennaniae]KAJ5665617.1 hypothetical protein N7477_008065 [Penicillium maclennaniae]
MLQKERAAFKPYPPDIIVNPTVDSIPNFEHVRSISCDDIDRNGLEQFSHLYDYWVIKTGRPLVIKGFQDLLDRRLFSSEWLQKNYGKKVENVRNLGKGANVCFSIGHYLNKLPALAGKITTATFDNPQIQRLYLKDIDCPVEWQNSLEQMIVPQLFYLNESPKSYLGPGSTFTGQSECPRTQEGHLIAKAGDLMSSLPTEMRAENLMCYIGHEGTYTPAHQEMCASLGHNLMVEASGDSVENGHATQQGSSVWFMTETKDRYAVAEYWASILGHDIDLEDHFSQLRAWEQAPFRTYLVEQKPGDLVLVPPLAAHQVWNRGTRTIKVAWNRTTVDTLEYALGEALPKARVVCRDEQYKNKAIYSSLLRHATRMDHPEVQGLWSDFRRLYKLYTDIMLSESFSKSPPPQDQIEFAKFDGNVTCSYCRCNIFNRFLTCPWCKSNEEDAYDVCMECYVMGRSCGCISKLKWVEQFPWKDLVGRHDAWRRQIVSNEAFVSGDDIKIAKSRFPTLIVVRGRLGRKPIAEICQEQLLLRPFTDFRNGRSQEDDQKEATPSDSEDRDYGHTRKRRKVQRPKRKVGQTRGLCHHCHESEPPWKLATCSACYTQYCFGSLFRAFNISPQDALERPRWVCPKCLKTCNCSVCRIDFTMVPYEPVRSFVGHDTRKVADPRSTDSLINMKLNNAHWVTMFGSDIEQRLIKGQIEENLKRSEVMNRSQPPDPPQQSRSNGNGAMPYRDFLEPHHDDPDDTPVDPALFEASNRFMSTLQDKTAN